MKRTGFAGYVCACATPAVASHTAVMLAAASIHVDVRKWTLAFARMTRAVLIIAPPRYVCRSVGLRAVILDDLRPLLAFLCPLPSAPRRRAADRKRRIRDQARLQVRRVDDLHELGIQARHDRLRRPSRHENAVPLVRLESRHTGFSDRGHGWQCRKTLSAR